MLNLYNFLKFTATISPSFTGSLWLVKIYHSSYSFYCKSLHKLTSCYLNPLSYFNAWECNFLPLLTFTNYTVTPYVIAIPKAFILDTALNNVDLLTWLSSNNVQIE